MSKEFLTTGEVAQYCGVNFRTVIRWIDKGLLKAYKLPGRGDNRIPVTAFLAFLDDNNMPIPDAFKSEPNDSILIVDDDPSIALTIQEILKRSGYISHIAYNGIEAGLAIAKHKPRLVTIDLGMPKFDGMQLLEFLKSNTDYRAIKTIVISAADQEELDEAIKAGADRVLNKPFTNELLTRTVTELLI